MENHVWCKLRIAHFGPKQINNVTIMNATPIHLQVVNRFLECSHECLKRHSSFVTVCDIEKSILRLVNMHILHHCILISRSQRRDIDPDIISPDVRLDVGVYI